MAPEFPIHMPRNTHQPRCCPNHAAQGRTVSIRVEEQADVAAFRKKMEQPEQKAICRQRGPVAEFPNAWIKEKPGLRKFRVRGNAEGGRGTGLGMPDLQRNAVVPADLAEDAPGSVNRITDQENGQPAAPGAKCRRAVFRHISFLLSITYRDTKH